MAVSPEYTAYIVEQLGSAGSIRTRKMFGGVGIYIDEVFCAIIGSSTRFFLRVGDGNREDYVKLGMEKFSGKKGSTGMPYFEVPEHVLEDQELLTTWALKARNAAVESKS